ncbi:MAG TPA: NapC/NirT family cytochrome c [bacterium]
MAVRTWINNKPYLKRFFAFFGIHFPEDKNDIIHFSRRFAYIIFGGIVFLFIGAIAFFQFSTSPYFCGTCHIMRPYYKSWKESSHNFVPCVDCHYPPGFTEEIRGKFEASVQVVKYITRTYSTKPYAEIDDASCLRKGCHSKRLLEGNSVFKNGINFDHKPHLTQLRRGRKLKCTSCHSQIVIGSHVAVTESVCFICHFKPEDNGKTSPIATCTICHEPPKKDFTLGGNTYNHKDFVERGVECTKCHVGVVEGKGEVPEEMCRTCHGEPERLEKYSDHKLIHDTHVTSHKVECFQCHKEIKHKVTTVHDFVKRDCSSCHFDKHGAQEKLYMGTGGMGVKDMPSPMFLARVDCIGCHILPKEAAAKSMFSGQTIKATEAGCLYCHGIDYKGIMNDWMATVSGHMNRVKVSLDEVQDKIKASGVAAAGAKKLFNDAMFNYNLVYYGRGVHNIEYATELLAKAEENLNKAKEMIEK